MRNLVYKFADGRKVNTYTQAVEIAKTERVPFTAEVEKVEVVRKVENPGRLKEKYRIYFIH
jgi:hypothetical protein